MLVFVGTLVRMMALRRRLPKQLTVLSPSPPAMTRAYHQHLAAQRAAYGPFVALVASAYVWALLGGSLLVADGVGLLTTRSVPVTLD